MSEAFVKFLLNMKIPYSHTHAKRKSLLNQLIKDTNIKSDLNINQVHDSIISANSNSNSRKHFSIPKATTNRMETPNQKLHKGAVFQIKSFRTQPDGQPICDNTTPKLVHHPIMHGGYEDSFRRKSMELKYRTSSFKNKIKVIESNFPFNSGDIANKSSNRTNDNSTKDLARNQKLESPMSSESHLSQRRKSRPSTCIEERELKLNRVRLVFQKMKHMFNSRPHKISKPTAKLHDLNLCISHKNILEIAQKNHDERNKHMLLKKIIFSKYCRKNYKPHENSSLTKLKITCVAKKLVSIGVST